MNGEQVMKEEYDDTATISPCDYVAFLTAVLAVDRGELHDLDHQAADLDRAGKPLTLRGAALLLNPCTPTDKYPAWGATDVLRAIGLIEQALEEGCPHIAEARLLLELLEASLVELQRKEAEFIAFIKKALGRVA
jgi:hypothetical protein